jgi:glycosyltransferase involved in cell wall biosynthesis
MANHKSPVSIGLPVFNGEKYLKEAVNSILAQTFQDFELIISDNASTDNTQRICQEYVANDSRVRYYRYEKNIEAPKNFNRVFDLSSGEYFKWAADDDVLAPQYLEKCVNVLSEDPSVVLCHSITGRIDENGLLVGICNKGLLRRIDSEKPHERFGDLIGLFHNACPLLGLGRRSAFEKSRLLGNYIGADRNLLAEIGLMGKIHEIPECLFFLRDHPGSYTSTFYGTDRSMSLDRLRKEMDWWSKNDWTSFPHWKTCSEYFKSVNRVRLNWSERLYCYDQIFRWIMHEDWTFLGVDLELFLLNRSKLARKLIPFTILKLKQAVIPFTKKIMQ